MKWLMLALGSAALIANAPAFAQSGSQAAHPSVLLKTSEGDIRVELYPEKAPKTVANFLDYVKSKPDVWICKRIDIARHWLKTHPFVEAE